MSKLNHNRFRDLCKLTNVRHYVFAVILMLITASAVYLICFYAPLVFWSQPSSRHSQTAQYFFLWLVFVQNSLNPIIYGIIVPQFREAYLRVFLWLLRHYSCSHPYPPRVYPASGSGEGAGALGGPPSVVFQSAKNSIVFPPNQFNSIHENRSPLPTSARNLELRVKDLKDTPPRANRGAESR
jgi:hypothetical protein